MVSVSVNLAAEHADIAFSGPPDAVAVIRAINDAGYEVGTESVDLSIEGMSCAACVNRIETSLKAVPGVTDAMVNLATGKASVEIVSDAVGVADLETSVERIG
ncbi:cation transporter [Chelativorans alearense]|uniref:cation transporter n=1 Tax=Chelativorans alearense TaxID=2681495 RepID=UPI003CCDF0E6